MAMTVLQMSRARQGRTFRETMPHLIIVVMRCFDRSFRFSLFILFLFLFCWAGSDHGLCAELQISDLLPRANLCRALRKTDLAITASWHGQHPLVATLSLELPPGIRLLNSEQSRSVSLAPEEETPCIWEVEAPDEGLYQFRLVIHAKELPPMERTLSLRFLPPREKRILSAIPDPQPVTTDFLIGAHACPLWEKDKPRMWDNIHKHPERTPALGFYSQENPDVADWETKWAVEHGISFFVYCWYRDGQGGAVKTRFGSAIHDGLFQSRFGDQMKFTLMWENQNRGEAGVSDQRDLMENLLPYWIENYFSRSNYLQIDGKPLLFIYRPTFLIDDLGGEENVRHAFDKMRETCRAAGFKGLWLLGEYRGTDPKPIEQMKRLGLDYTFAYCWPVPGSPSPEKAIQTQIESITKVQQLNILPQVLTVSQAWSGWRDEGSLWKIPPDEFETLLRRAKTIAETLPENELGRKMMLLDNWNEWGEGHYIAPYREYGFGYLDAVRRVFSTAPEAHDDLLPEDIGLGPYDTEMRAIFAREARLSRQSTRVIRRADVPEGLIAWWDFDEKPDDSEVILDVSGHRLGGVIHRAARVTGFRGQALECAGGSVTVAPDLQPELGEAFSVDCRVWTDKSDQSDKWFLNRIFGDHTSGGFRFGLAQGRAAFHLPLTPWSHQIAARNPLPLGRWVHLAATFDGQKIRLYMDGQDQGALERPGPVGRATGPLVLGNYAVDHAAHFTGRLDEVRLWKRVLTPEEIHSFATEK